MQESSVTPCSYQCTFFTPCTTVSKCYSLQSLLISSNSSSIGEATTTTAYHFKGNSTSPSHNYLFELGLLNQLRNWINSILKLSPYVNVVSHSIFFSFQVNLPWSVLCHYRLSYLQLDCLSYHYLKSSAKMVNIIFSDVAGLKTVTMWHLFDIIHDTIVPLAWYNASRYDRFHETWKKSHSTDDRAFKVSQNHLDVMVYVFKKSGDVRKIFWSCWLSGFSRSCKPPLLLYLR